MNYRFSVLTDNLGTRPMYVWLRHAREKKVISNRLKSRHGNSSEQHTRRCDYASETSETPFSHRTKYSGCRLSLRWLGHTCLARRRYSESHLVDVSCRPQHPLCNVIYFQVYDPRDSPRREIIAAAGADSQRQREYTTRLRK